MTQTLGGATTVATLPAGVLPAEPHRALYIDGQWTDATGSDRFAVTDPATAQVLAEVANGTAADARAATAAAAAAFPAWSSTGAYERAEILYAAWRRMLERADELAELMTIEQGKPLRAARNEVSYAADFLLWYAEEGKRVYGSSIPPQRKDQRLTVLRQPVGVVGAITPWNYPISMITRKLAPALAAGCTIVMKPAEQTPLCAMAVFKILAEVGLPAGVANLVTTAQPEAIGDVILDDPEVRKITFTGSTEVGKMLAARAASTMKRVSLELGGHAPFLVFDDADVEHAAKGATLVKFLNSGQACISPNRIYVQETVYDRFIEVMVDRVGKLRTGHGLEQGTNVGPLIDLPSLEKMARQVDDATDKGGEVLIGGTRLTGPGYDAGYFFAPTVLAGVSQDMTIYTEETFGPIAAVLPFTDEDEAISKANDTKYGLASYLYTRDLGRSVRVSEALRFGIVGVNDINPTAAAAPFGGAGESGIGREGGYQGIEEYLETKLVGVSL